MTSRIKNTNQSDSVKPLKSKISKSKGKLIIRKEMISPMFSIVENFCRDGYQGFKPLSILNLIPSSDESTPLEFSSEIHSNQCGDLAYLLCIKNGSLILEKVHYSEPGITGGQSTEITHFEVDYLTIENKDIFKSEIFRTYNGDAWLKANNKVWVYGW